ncbi:MAG: hypothetical protein RLZZ501_1305 [Pseudomonadota bacterium]
MAAVGRIGLVVLFSLVWSSAFVAGKIALAELDSFTLLAARFGLAALVLLPVLAGGIDRRALRVGLLLGLLNNALYLGLTFSGLKLLRPEIVVVAVSCTPFLTRLFAAAAGQEKLAARPLVGLGLGIAGVAVMAGLTAGAAPDPRGLALVAAGTVAFALATVLTRDRAHGLPPLALTFWQSAAGALALLPAALLFGAPVGMPSAATVAALIYLAFGATIGGLALWVVLIRRHGPGTAASFHLLNPPFGVALSALAFATPLRGEDLLGTLRILLGLGLTLAPGRAAAVFSRQTPR